LNLNFGTTRTSGALLSRVMSRCVIHLQMMGGSRHSSFGTLLSDNCVGSFRLNNSRILEGDLRQGGVLEIMMQRGGVFWAGGLPAGLPVWGVGSGLDSASWIPRTGRTIALTLDAILRRLTVNPIPFVAALCGVLRPKLSANLVRMSAPSRSAPKGASDSVKLCSDIPRTVPVPNRRRRSSLEPNATQEPLHSTRRASC
jgi:hypothetical protein